MIRSTVSSCESNHGHLSNCRSILQEIIWMIDNWENAILSYRINKREEEIIYCENALMKVKDLIWTSCLTMFSKYDPRTKERRDLQSALSAEPEMTDSILRVGNIGDNVHETNGIPVTLHQNDSTHGFFARNNPQKHIVKNLLLEWSVFLNPQFQLCVMGTIPNGGKWETSPISTRLGPNSVKTTSGTMYTMNGKMVVNEDGDIPPFVQEKFQNGFPIDWKDIASRWIRMLKGKNCGLPPPKDLTGDAEIQNTEADSAPNDIREQVDPAPNQVQQPKDKIVSALSEENQENNASNLTERHEENEKGKSAEGKPDKKTGKEKVADNKVPSLLPRFSKRLLSKSLEDNGSSSEKEDSFRKKISPKRLLYLKDWDIVLSRRHDKLVLCGTLINENGEMIEEDHLSVGIAHRLQADIVETDRGDHYRLVGTSASKIRELDFGFPIHWQNYIEKLKAQPLPSLTSKGNSPLRRGRARSVSRMEGSNTKDRHQTSAVNRQSRSLNSKTQSMMFEARMNGALNRRINASSGKMDSVSLNISRSNPLKRTRSKSEGPSKRISRAIDDSMVSITIGSPPGILKALSFTTAGKV